jgi:predicted Rossmann fold nucleotide-binding protein DprA/Smf involved in DNA uptake
MIGMGAKKIGIIGSRSFNNKKQVYALLDKIFKKYPDAMLVSGGANGPDSFAYQYCIDYGYDILVCGAGWVRYGKRAGMMRNQRIADNSDIIIAFWDGVSTGTEDCMRKAKDAGKVVYIFNSNTQELIAY